MNWLGPEGEPRPENTTGRLKPEPTIEVLLCSYNGSRYLQQQLESIFLQNLRVTRISVFDDHSTDETPAIAERLASKAASIGIVLSVHRNAGNIGWIENFSQAIQASQCDILFLCDQDDIWSSRKVSELVKALSDPGTSLAFSDGELINAQGQIMPGTSVLQALGLGPTQLAGNRDQIFLHLQRANFIGGASLAIKREAALAALPAPIGMPLDYWLALHSGSRNACQYVHGRLYQYRQHPLNVIGADRRSSFRHLLDRWRQPFSTRMRELETWTSVMDRLSSQVDARRRLSMQQKNRFLQDTVPYEDRFIHRIKKCLSVLRHLVVGNYRKFSPPYSAWSDFFATIRRR